MRTFDIGEAFLAGGSHLFMIAGPCVIEDERITLEIARRLKGIFAETLGVGIPLIFKASYDKANRTSLGSFRGPGLERGLEILDRVRDQTGFPVLSDVHSVDEVARAAEVLDVLQVPALLCRQTDLVVEAARTMKPVNLKKGQFISPQDMRYVIEKASSTGNDRILVTEQGTCFGYNDLVVDFRSLAVLRGFGYPVVLDAGHSIGGHREFIAPLARAAVAVGVNGVFLEVHTKPDKARCDGQNSLDLADLPGLLAQLSAIQMGLEIGCRGKVGG